MTTILLDWLGLLLRWAHVLTGIAWIGSSFYFIWLDASLRKRKLDDATIAGESWMVHGGGFYQVEKYVVAPEKLPEELHWFKYEAYFTWATGIGLLAIIYYWGADIFLIDKSRLELSSNMAILLSVATLAAGWVAYDLLCRSAIGRHTTALSLAVFALVALAAWGYGEVFAGRAAFVHIGVFIGTIMAANVFFIIIPNQKKTVAALLSGDTPQAVWGVQAKQRSLHNNYLTLPVVFMMISNHYPMTFAHPSSWVIAVGIVLAGGLVRLFFNTHNSGKLTPGAIAAIPAAALVVIGLIFFTAGPQATGDLGEPVEFADVNTIIATHCSACHSARPTHESFDKPPANVSFDKPADIKRFAARIRAQTAISKIMPLGNETEMQDEDRDTLNRWVLQGAPLE